MGKLHCSNTLDPSGGKGPAVSSMLDIIGENGARIGSLSARPMKDWTFSVRVGTLRLLTASLLGIGGRPDIAGSPAGHDKEAAAGSFAGGTLGLTTRRASECINHHAPHGLTKGKVGCAQGVLAQFAQDRMRLRRPARLLWTRRGMKSNLKQCLKMEKVGRQAHPLRHLPSRKHSPDPAAAGFCRCFRGLCGTG